MTSDNALDGPTNRITDMTTAVTLAQTLAADIATRADAADRSATLPVEDLQLLRASGYLALSVPRALGGHGLSLRDCIAAHVALAQGSAATAMVAAMQLHLFGHEREVRSWNPGRLEAFATAVLQGALFNSLASEPQLGSPSRGGLPATTAVAATDDGRDGFRINGRKTWATGGRHLTHMLVRVALAEEPAVVLVEQNRAGIRWEETWRDALSLRASESHDVFFEDVFVPAGNLVQRGVGSGRPNVWFPMLMAAVYLGTAVAARNVVIRFALERVPTALGRPIATLPKIQRQIGEIDVALQSAQALLLEVAGEWHGRDADREACMPRVAAAKTAVTAAANFATDQALQVAGGTSISGALPLERYFRDVRAGSMQPPAGDTALEMVGRAAIGSL